MKFQRIMLILSITVLMAGFLAFTTIQLANAKEKITICHAAGLAGTEHFVELNVSENAYFGHFDNFGTPLAGHEEDFLGSCSIDPL
jgi:hypothetical protein